MKTMALIAVAVLAACGADAPMTATPATHTARTAHPAPAPVRTAPRVDASALASHNLAVNSLPQLQLLATAAGRGALAQVVACALPLGASITVINASGTPYSFRGAAGLAPAWVERAPTSDEHRRVAACVGDRARV